MYETISYHFKSPPSRFSRTLTNISQRSPSICLLVPESVDYKLIYIKDEKHRTLEDGHAGLCDPEPEVTRRRLS